MRWETVLLVTTPYLTAMKTDGTSDATFTTVGTRFNGNVTWLTPMGSKVIASGRFTAYNGAALPYITRLNGDGTLDSTFTSPGTGFNNVVYSTLVDSSGKIVVAGAFRTYNGVSTMHLARLNADGSLDTTLSLAGTGFNYQSNTIAIDSSNRILVGGFFTNYNGVTAKYIARVNSDGSLDTSFTTGTGFNNEVQSILLDSSGRIIVIGEFTNYNGTAVGSIVRLNANGTLDTTFNAGGAGFNAATWKMAIDSSGRILVGGAFATYNGVATPHLARLNSDGTLDTTFTYTGTGLNSDVYSVQIDANNKIMIGGPFTTYNGVSVPYVARLNTDGTLDQTFVSPGAGLNGAVYRILLMTVSL